MAHAAAQTEAMPVVARREDFDERSGTLLERLIFNHRALLVAVCVLITVLLGFAATKLEVNASFEKMMPTSHPFIQNYRANAASLRGLGNSVRIVVANANTNANGDEKATIYDPKYLQVLREINEAVFLLPGVDRSFMKSLWMSVIHLAEPSNPAEV